MLRYESYVFLKYSSFSLADQIIYYQVSMATKMATVEKASELLEKLRSSSWNPAVQGISLDVIF